MLTLKIDSAGYLTSKRCLYSGRKELQSKTDKLLQNHRLVEGSKGEAYLFKWERGKWGGLLGAKSPLEETGNRAVAGGGRRMRKALPGVVSAYKVKTL